VREFVIIADTRRDAHDRDMQLAWHVAALSRQPRLPPLRRLLARRHVAGQTRGEVRTALSALSQQYGIPLRVRRVPGSRPYGD
jgi:hypothetical protein